MGGQMKVSAINGVNYSVNNYSANVKSKNNANSYKGGINELSNHYYSPINFQRRYKDHFSRGAQIDPITKNVTFELASWKDNKSVEVEIIKKDNPDETYKFPMEHIGDGIYRSDIISKKIAKAGDSYRYIITKNDGTIETVKDPYSYCQDKLMGESVLYDHNSYKWNDKKWYHPNNKQRISRIANAENGLTPTSDLRIYEMHIGTLTKKGDFEAAKETLQKIKDLGFNAIEVMPVEGTYSFNWGYDGVDKFAVSKYLAGDASKCAPDEFKSFVDYAHNVGLNVIMDMVPNHLGPDGSQLGKTGPYLKGPNDFGDAFNFEGEDSKHTREFIVDAALYWPEKFHVDGIRFDMTKYMKSDYTMKEIAAESTYHNPHIFLIAEDARNNISVDNKTGEFHENKRVIHDKRVVNPLLTFETGEGLEEDYHVFAIEQLDKLDGDLSRLGYDSEWDFDLNKQIRETLYGNMDMKALIRAYYESENRVSCPETHDDIGNEGATRMISRLMVPILHMPQKVVLDDKDYDRMSKLDPNRYGDLEVMLKAQKAQESTQKLVELLCKGKFQKYLDAIGNGDDMDEVQAVFGKEILKPLGINPDCGLTPQKIINVFMACYNTSKMNMGMHYGKIGPVMVFQGDEHLDITPFRFAREFESIPVENYIYNEKGYYPDEEAYNDSKLGKNYPRYSKKMAQAELLTSDLNGIKATNPALTRGKYKKASTIEHNDSRVFALHAKDDESQNEIFKIVNTQNLCYPREDVDFYYIKFPEGEWEEILNTDDKKYGGFGDTNKNIVKADGQNDVPIKLGRKAVVFFRKIPQE